MSDEINQHNKQKVMESHIFGASPEKNQQNAQSHVQKPQNQIKRATSRVAALPPLQAPDAAAEGQRVTVSNKQLPDFHLEVQDIEPYHRIQQNRPQNRPQIDENRYELVTPHGSRFAANATVMRPQTPTFEGLIKESNVPPLSPFPDFSFEAPQIQTNFEFRVRPLTTQSNRNVKKLHVTSNNEIRKMRDEIQADSAQFSARIHGLKNEEAEHSHIKMDN